MIKWWLLTSVVHGNDYKYEVGGTAEGFLTAASCP